jgi:hypothetical protein
MMEMGSNPQSWPQAERPRQWLQAEEVLPDVCEGSSYGITLSGELLNGLTTRTSPSSCPS